MIPSADGNQSIQPTVLSLEESKKELRLNGECDKRAKLPLVHRAQELMTPEHPGKGEKARNSCLLHTTGCQPSCLSPPKNPDAFIWFKLKQDKFPAFAAVSGTLTIHTLKNRNAVKWKREGLAREAEPPQFTQLSKCHVKILVLRVIILLRRQSASVFASVSSRQLFKIRKNCCSCLPTQWTFFLYEELIFESSYLLFMNYPIWNNSSA